MFQQAAQRAEKISDVQAGDAFVVFTQLRQGCHFEQLFKGAQATGQGNERIGVFTHARFAIAHIVGHFMLGQPAVQVPEVEQATGNDTDHFTTLGQRGVGHHAH